MSETRFLWRLGQKLPLHEVWSPQVANVRNLSSSENVSGGPRTGNALSLRSHASTANRLTLRA